MDANEFAGYMKLLDENLLTEEELKDLAEMLTEGQIDQLTLPQLARLPLPWEGPRVEAFKEKRARDIENAKQRRLVPDGANPMTNRECGHLRHRLREGKLSQDEVRDLDARMSEYQWHVLMAGKDKARVQDALDGKSTCFERWGAKVLAR